MKRNNLLLAFSLIILFLSACSSDDDGGNPSNAPIIGEWQLDRIIFQGTELNLQPCEDEEELIFEAQGAFFNNRYTSLLDTEELICELQNSTQGAWIVDDNGVYFINLQGDFIEFPVSINEDLEELTLNETDPQTGATQQRIFKLRSSND